MSQITINNKRVLTDNIEEADNIFRFEDFDHYTKIVSLINL
jgi:hypothetical protein